MASKMEENNIFFITLVITVTIFPFVATQNINCQGKAFHCVNSTHFKICVDLGGGISTTVDDFVIPCPTNTVCKDSNYFECEYITTTTLKSTQEGEVPNNINVTPSLKNIDIATTLYKKTSENKLSEIVMSTIPSSKLIEFKDLTTESALKNTTSDFSDSDKYSLRETTIEEPLTANEELTTTTFAKVTLDNIEYNDKVKINIKPTKYHNISGTELGNALLNSSLSKNFYEDHKISDIENSTNLIIDFSSNYDTKNKKDNENLYIKQLPVSVVKNTIFDGFTNSSPIDYTTEIDQGSYNTKNFVNGVSIEGDITLVSYNKTSNRSISSNNINNLTETETLPLASDKLHNLINVTTDKTSVQKLNNTELAEIGEIIIDPTIELRILDNWDNMPTSEVYKNNGINGSTKDLRETSIAVKYTATDKNIFYNPVTVTEAENLLITETIDNTITDSPYINNSTSWLNNKIEERPNLNYAVVDLLQNTERSTLNDVKVLKNIIPPDEQLLTTKATLISNKFLTSNLNLASQLEHEGTTKDFNNTLSKNNSANVSLSTITSLKLEEKENTEIVRDMAYTTKPSLKLDEISSQSYFLKQISSFSSTGAINTESTNMTNIYTSMKNQNTYPTPTLYKDEHNIEPTPVKDELNSEVLTFAKDTTINNYNEEVTVVPNNSFILVSTKNNKTVGSKIHYTVYEKKTEKLTTQAAFHSFTSNESVYKETSTLDPIQFKDNILVSLYQFGNTTVQDIESKNSITNDEIEVPTGTYNNISNTHYINDIVNSDAIIVERTNFPNETKNIFNIFDNFNVTHVFNKTLIEPRVNFTGNINVLILDTTTEMPIENIDEKRTDTTTNFGLKQEQNENSKTKMSDGVFIDSHLKIFRESTENIENRKPLIFSTTEMGDINGYKATEINMNILGGSNDTIDNSVNNPPSSHINITKENNTQILTYFNNTEHMNVNSIDNNENIHILNNLKVTAKEYTTPYMDTTFMNATVPIFSVTSGTEITTEMYNSSEYNSSQHMTHDTTVNDNDKTEIITLKNSEIIELNAAAEITLQPRENISKNASENVKTHRETLINVIRNFSLDQNNVTNTLSFNKTKFLENTNRHNKNTTADINIVQNILKETNNILLLNNNNNNNNIATVIDIPSYYSNVSKESIMNNTDVKLHFPKDNKEIMHNSYNIQARAMHSNDNINMVNVSDSDNFNKQISNNSSFRDVDLNMRNNNNGEIKEMKLIEIEDTLKRDKKFNDVSNNTIQSNGYTKTKAIEIKDDRTVNLLANNTTSMSEQYENNNSNINKEKYVFNDTVNKNNVKKSNKTFLNEFENKNFKMNTDSVNVTKIAKTKIRITLPQLSITDIPHEDTRNEPISIENNKTNQMIPHNTVTQNMSVINSINSFDDSNISLNTSKNGVGEANQQTNFKNINADQMQPVNGEVRADNFSGATNVTVATYTKNITRVLPFSLQATQNSYRLNVNETNVNESFNKSQDLHISSTNKNLTVNLERSSNTLILHNTETNNSLTNKNDIDMVFNATQPSNIHFSTGYIDMGTSSLNYNSVSQQDLPVTRQPDDSRLFPDESKTFSTTSTNIIRDDWLYTDMTSHLVKDNADVPQIPKTVGYDVTTSPYEEKNKVTHSMKDIANIEENKNIYGNFYTNEHQTKVATTVASFLSETTHNIRQIPATQPTDVLKPITCQVRSHGKYPDEHDCNKFYICVGKRSPIIGKCPNGTVFSDIKKQCTNNLSHCVINNQFKCLAEGRFVDVMSNDYYYICAKSKRGFVRFKLKCQEGYYLNINTIHCLLKDTLDEDSKNTSESRTKESVSSETFSLTKSFICVNEGKFEFPEDCRKYYVCTKKSSAFRRRLKQCESDEVFDRDRKKCVDDESYECRF